MIKSMSNQTGNLPGCGIHVGWFPFLLCKRVTPSSCFERVFLRFWSTLETLWKTSFRYVPFHIGVSTSFWITYRRFWGSKYDTWFLYRLNYELEVYISKIWGSKYDTWFLYRLNYELLDCISKIWGSKYDTCFLYRRYISHKIIIDTIATILSLPTLYPIFKIR